jgi:hypothetical protein
MNGMPNMPNMPKKDGCSAAMMNMQFHQNINDPLLFASLYTCSVFWYIVLCLAVAALGIFNEYLKFYKRSTLRKKFKTSESPSLDPLIRNVNDGGKTTGKQKGFIAIFTFFTLSIDFTLMLVTMTFNFGYFFATILGLVIGKYVFAFDDESAMSGRQLSEANCH